MNDRIKSYIELGYSPEEAIIMAMEDYNSIYEN